jgi:hypothetical protein
MLSSKASVIGFCFNRRDRCRNGRAGHRRRNRDRLIKNRLRHRADKRPGTDFPRARFRHPGELQRTVLFGFTSAVLRRSGKGKTGPVTREQLADVERGLCLRPVLRKRLIEQKRKAAAVILRKRGSSVIGRGGLSTIVAYGLGTPGRTGGEAPAAFEVAVSTQASTSM